MRIAVDAVAANQDLRTGVGEYAFRLLCAMMKETSSLEEVFLYTDRPLGTAWPPLPSNWKNEVLPWRFPGWASIRLCAALMILKPDVAFFPASSPPRWISFGTKKRTCVATIHDIGFERFPRFYIPSDRRRQRRALRQSIATCSRLFAVSEFTKSELIEVEHVDPDRITVTPLSVNRDIFRPASVEAVEQVRQTYHLSRHYFLFVSRIDAKKNIEQLIRAFEIFKDTRGFGDPHELVLVGPPGFGFASFKTRVEASAHRKAIHLLGPVSEEEKVALYTGALGYVTMSWYEGFGLTPLEAAACGTPSLLSDIPAHREVMGEGAVYVSPRAPEEIAAAWKHFAEEATRRASVLERAEERLSHFSWEKTAEITWEGLRGAPAPDQLFTTRL